MLVLSTVPTEDVAAALARTLVEEGLAACVNILPGMRSLYAWRGETCDDREVLCLIKTRRALFPALRDRLTALHPYEVPEIVALAAEEVSRAYLDWVSASTGG